MENYFIDGMKRFENEETETLSYFTNEMLVNNILLTEDTYFFEENHFGTTVSLKHYDDFDAIDYTIFEGELLAPIQVYRIIKDIYDLYQSNSVGEFLNVINQLSVASQSSSMQSTVKDKYKIYKWIIDSFEEIKING